MNKTYYFSCFTDLGVGLNIFSRIFLDSLQDSDLPQDDQYVWFYGGARGVMVIVVGNGHGDTSSNPGREWLHFT